MFYGTVVFKQFGDKFKYGFIDKVTLISAVLFFL